MGARVVLDSNPDTGFTEYFEYDEASDTVRLSYAQDCTALLDRNKAMYADPDCSWAPGRELRHVASVNEAIQMEWQARYGIEAWNPNHKKAIKRLLNSSDYVFLRTAPGYI